MPAGVSFSSFPRNVPANFVPVLSDAGQIIYTTILTGSGVSSTNNDAIFAGAFAAPQLVAREGNATRALPRTGVGSD